MEMGEPQPSQGFRDPLRPHSTAYGGSDLFGLLDLLHRDLWVFVGHRSRLAAERDCGRSRRLVLGSGTVRPGPSISWVREE